MVVSFIIILRCIQTSSSSTFHCEFCGDRYIEFKIEIDETKFFCQYNENLGHPCFVMRLLEKYTVVESRPKNSQGKLSFTCSELLKDPDKLNVTFVWSTMDIKPTMDCLSDNFLISDNAAHLGEIIQIFNEEEFDFYQVFSTPAGKQGTYRLLYRQISDTANNVVSCFTPTEANSRKGRNAFYYLGKCRRMDELKRIDFTGEESI